MSAHITKAVPILPAADFDASITWWTEVCGFTVAFRQGSYAGLMRDDTYLHLSGMSDAGLARTLGDQTMVRFHVDDIDAFYAEYQQRGGTVHANGTLQTKPWGTREFAAIDPCGVCISFVQLAHR
jgi:catechol 2,3-dioxygenase-like lactoylglutathione lyase family enzyme